MDLAPLFEHPGDLPTRTDSAIASGLKGSAILAIAGEVGALRATGAPVANFTVGDFSPDQFRVPQSLADQVQAGGVPYNRLTTIGRGENDPVASNLTPEGKAQNRRVEIVVIPQET